MSLTPSPDLATKLDFWGVPRPAPGANPALAGDPPTLRDAAPPSPDAPAGAYDDLLSGPPAGTHAVAAGDGPPSLDLAGGGPLGRFRLLALLGSGAQGHVYLATQPGLADRPVVLKLTRRTGGEHLTLARLQHANVVPLYGAQDEPALDRRLLCMPYFGGAPLDRVLDGLAGTPPAGRTGRDLLAALDRIQAAAGHADLAPPPRGPARRLLERADYAQALAWLAAGLADGLQYAHERGLVHLDVKPSNVLLAADGTPMLLDFHLARAPLPTDRAAPPWVGGTSGYMPPEQLRALAAYHGRRPLATPVDRRADLFALGALLYQALGGELPFAPHHSPPLCHMNPRVSVGLSDIVAKCLAADPADRYPDAAALAADLRCHLTDRPLLTAPNRSLAERWRKWRRRRPHALTGLAAAAVVVAALATGGYAVLHERDGRLTAARAALAAGQEQLRQGQAAAAAATLRHGLDLAAADPELSRLLAAHARSAERRAALAELHRCVDQLRRAFPFEGCAAGDLQALEAPGRALWEQGDQIVAEVEPDESERVRRDLLDLAVLTGELRVRMAGDGDRAVARRAALALLAEAEGRFGPGPVLSHERWRHERDLGGSPAPPVAGPGALTAWEHYALGRSWLSADDLPRAAESLQAALRLEPEGLWPNFAWGQCAYRLKRYDDAVAAFSVCVGAAPGLAECFFNRALAQAALSRAEPAAADYGRALQLSPGLASAALNRGVLRYQQGRLDAAEADLRQALAGGADPAAAHYNLALVRLARGDARGARQSVGEALRRQPAHAGARALCDRMGWTH